MNALVIALKHFWIQFHKPKHGQEQFPKMSQTKLWKAEKHTKNDNKELKQVTKHRKKQKEENPF